MSPARLLLSSLLAGLAAAQDQTVQFGQVANINGDMALNRLTFPDNSKIETFSQTQSQILVNQNTAPLGANSVIGSTGQPFVQLSQNSMVIATTGSPDLVGAQIAMPIDPALLAQAQVSPDNTFVARLTSDRQAWVIMENQKSVNLTDNTVRMVKLSNIDGEFMAVGRQTVETGQVLTSFGQGQQESVAVTGGGFQEIEMADGLRMSIRANQPMTVNTEVVNGIDSSTLTGGAMPVNNFRYLVTTSLGGLQTGLDQMSAVVQIPLNAERVVRMAMSAGGNANSLVQLNVAQRGVLQNPGGAVQGQPAVAGTTGATAIAARMRKMAARAAVAASSSATEDDSDDEETPMEGNATQGNATEGNATEGNATASTNGTAVVGTNSTAVTNGTAVVGNNSTAVSNGTAVLQNNSTISAGLAAATQSIAATAPPAAVAPLLLEPTFTELSGKSVLDRTSGRVAVPVTQLDGEYIITMEMVQGGQQQQAGQQAAAAAQQPQAEQVTAGAQPATKRQASTAQAGNGLVMTMSEIMEMATVQANGGVLPVLAMMQEFATAQGQSLK